MLTRAPLKARTATPRGCASLSQRLPRVNWRPCNVERHRRECHSRRESHEGERMAEEKRVARCACGGLSVTVQGEPEFVVLCHCTQCQRRTGSPFGVGAYFLRSAAALNGASKTFVRAVEGSERTVT